MSFITEPENHLVEFGCSEYLVNPSFDVILDIQSLYREEDLNSLDKLNQALLMLGISGRKICRLSIPERKELLKLIYKQCVNTRKHASTNQKMPLMDFDHDSEYIYASFMLDYGIDLVDQQGCISWKKFIALFQGLSERSKIREVMRIRNMDVPKYNGKNMKEIQQIQELKSFYALPVRGGGGQQGLDLLFSTLEGMAVKNG